jgi:hypothetical protein
LHLTGFLSKAQEWLAPAEVIKREPAREKGKKKGSPGAQGVRRAQPESPRFSFAGVAITSVVFIALVAFGGTTLAFSFSQLQFGVGITEHKFSFKASEFLRANPIPGKMFNFFDIGGFLDWQLYPQALTFIDGRTYNKEVFLEHQTVTGALQGWEKVLEKYKVTYVVLKGMDSSGMILPIVPTLANDPNWALVFSDGLFLVFVRNTTEMRDYIRRHEIPKEILPQHIIRESYHYIFLGVSPAVAYQTMSNMYLVMGNRDKAIQALRDALEEWDDPYLRARIRQLEGGAGSR